MVKNRIGMLRREIGLNQKELGDRLGVGQTTVSAWETGKNEPDYKSIRAMAELFEVSADFLLGFIDDNIRRGLSSEKYAAIQAKRQEQFQERELEREIARHDASDNSDEVDPDVLEDIELSEWQDSGLPVQFETYKVINLMENASKQQRELVLRLVQATLCNP